MVSKKEEPYSSKLRGIELFTGNSINDQSINESSSDLDINLIVKPPSQPRRYFDRQALEQLKSSISQHGILEPLLVRPLADGKYELVAGERRFRVAMELNLTSVPVSIKTLTDLEAKQIALIENLQREDLNPVEETEGILELLSIQLNQEVELIINLLYKMQNEKIRVNGNVSIKNETKIIIDLFESLGMKWESFIRTRLPLLKLPDDILQALRAGQLAYTKAIELSKIKDEQQREKLLKESIELNLSLREIKEKIKQLLVLTCTERSRSVVVKVENNLIVNEKSPTKTVKDLVRSIEQKKLWETEPKKWERVEKLLEKIKLLMN